MSRATRAAIVLACLVMGCGPTAEGDAARQKVYKVRGKITMSGGAVANAMVSFSPKSKQPVATGRTGADGTFTLTTYDAEDGAAAGDYVVLVTKEAAVAASSAVGHEQFKSGAVDGAKMHANLSGGGGGEGSASSLPSKYGSSAQSDLAVTVKPDNSNEFNLELKP